MPGRATSNVGIVYSRLSADLEWPDDLKSNSNALTATKRGVRCLRWLAKRRVVPDEIDNIFCQPKPKSNEVWALLNEGFESIRKDLWTRIWLALEVTTGNPNLTIQPIQPIQPILSCNLRSRDLDAVPNILLKIQSTLIFYCILGWKEFIWWNTETARPMSEIEGFKVCVRLGYNYIYLACFSAAAESPRMFTAGHNSGISFGDTTRPIWEPDKICRFPNKQSPERRSQLPPFRLRIERRSVEMP